MYLGYHAYSLVDHYLPDAVEVLSDLGYGGVALPLSSSRLHPRLYHVGRLSQIAAELDAARSMRNAQFVLDATGPFLLSSVSGSSITLLESTKRLGPQPRTTPLGNRTSSLPRQRSAVRSHRSIARRR